jgi:hypothetical protein
MQHPYHRFIKIKTNYMKKLTWIFTIILLLSFTVNPVNGHWKKLVKKDLSGWEQLNGTAPFRVEKGVVIGTTALDSPNSFLCTKEKYKTPYEPVILQFSYLDNVLTSREVKEGWKLLFDGKTSAGWISAKTRSFPACGWDIRNGILSVNPESKKPGEGGDIVTTGKYKNFELSVDFLYTTGANSGMKYFVDTESDNGSLASIGCEYQVLDDRNNPDAKAGIAGNRTLAGLYDLIAPVNKRDNGVNQWSRAVIIVNGNKVQHWLNGFMTVEYERSTPEWEKLVTTSKFKSIKGFGENKEGRILLQDHGNVVSFKNIKIREF